jgi:hypothetical protein
MHGGKGEREDKIGFLDSMVFLLQTLFSSSAIKAFLYQGN